MREAVVYSEFNPWSRKKGASNLEEPSRRSGGPCETQHVFLNRLTILANASLKCMKHIFVALNLANFVRVFFCPLVTEISVLVQHTHVRFEMSLAKWIDL